MSSFPQSRQYRTGSGTPQALCRDMHQSGRFSTMLPMRLMVQSGIHSTSFIAWRAPPLKVLSSSTLPSNAMNHCGVALKTTGFLQRQQCGYCLLYTSDAADDLLCVDLGGRRIIKKK